MRGSSTILATWSTVGNPEGVKQHSIRNVNTERPGRRTCPPRGRNRHAPNLPCRPVTLTAAVRTYRT
eukprot:3645056-Prymnesium_polylepis.2